MGTLVADIRHALRQFRSARVFTITAVSTLAIGIGGTTAIFTLIHAVMLRSLPVGDPAALYRIGDGDNCCVQGGTQDRWGMVSHPLFERLRTELPEFESLTAFQAGMGRMSARRPGVDAVARAVRTSYVDGRYFSTLGVPAFGGRVFTTADDQADAPPVVVMSHHAWAGIYGADPKVIGSTLVIEGHPFTVVGVTGPGFFGETLRGDPADLWIPLHQEPLIAGETALLRQPVSAWLRVIGRLKPGATTDGMGARLTGVLHQWLRHDSGFPSNWMPDVIRELPQQSIAVVPAGGGVGVMREQYSRSLRILLGVCALVLLIACANVANLLLARSVARSGQTAVRLALGASRRRVITQALVESVLLAIGGGIVGLFVAIGTARLLLRLAFAGTTFLPIDTMPSPLVLAFAFGLALLTGILFGAAPAWLATRTNPIEALRGAGRSSGDHSSFTRKALVVLQAAVSVVLVVGSILLARSLSNLQHQDFGFPLEGRVLVQVNRLPASYPPAKLDAVYRDVETRIKQLPGVRGGGLAMYNPFTDNWGEGIIVDGQPPPPPGAPSGASWDRVSATYLQDLGVKLVRGRHLDARDRTGSENVAIVNERFVRQFFSHGVDPIGRYFGLNMPENSKTFRIVGVVRDARFAGFNLQQPPRAMFFVPLAQTVEYANPMMKRLETSSHFIRGILLVTDQSPSTLEPLVMRTLAAADPNLTVTTVRTLQTQIDRAFDQPRAVASLAGLFGIVALVLAAIGLYGVTAYAVTQRTREIGVRIALGAGRGSVVGMVLAGAFRRVGVGLALGLPLAVGAGYLLSAQLYGVQFWDPLALAAGVLALGVSAFVAAIVPARRAASISPIRALRTD